MHGFFCWLNKNKNWVLIFRDSGWVLIFKERESEGASSGLEVPSEVAGEYGWWYTTNSGKGTMKVIGREGKDYKEDEERESYNIGGYIINCTLIDLRVENNGV